MSDKIEKYNLINPGRSHVIISPAIGCNHSCIYCNGKNNIYQKNYSPKETLRSIKTSKYIKKDETSFLFYAYSDPFLEENVDDLLEILNGLDKSNWGNKVALITKINPSIRAINSFKYLRNLKVAIFVSYSNMIEKIESPSNEERLELMKNLFNRNIPTVCYISPLVKEWSPKKNIEELVLNIQDKVDAVTLSGIRLTDRIVMDLNNKKIPIPYTYNKILKYDDIDYFDYVEDMLKLKTNLPVFRSVFNTISYLYK